jgi:hypothetical protein
MANRNTRLIIKNSVIPSQTLPSSGVLQGEALVNLGDGILFFSGGSAGSPTWVPAGASAPSSGYFEVGSNLYNLKIRNQITSYGGGGSLVGQFLSGTSTGFVLAPISSIIGVDTYVTGFTYNDNNVLTITQTAGGPTKDVLFDKMSGLTVNGLLNVNNITITGSATYNKTATGSTEIVNYGTLTAFSQTNDIYVTGNTLIAANNNTNTQSAQLEYHGTPIGGPHFISTQNTFTTGGTYSNSTKLVTFKRNDGATGYTVDLSNIDTNDTYVTGGTITTAPSNNSISGQTQLSYNNAEVGGPYYLPFTDVFTTGFTYDSASNSFTISDNSGNTFTKGFTTVSGLTFTNLTAGRVVYVGANKELKDESGFEYVEASDKLIVGNLAVNNTTSAATFGNGGVIIGSGGNYGTAGTGDLVVNGSLTVFGPSISAFTSELYVEDNNIILNYNPTGSSQSTSIGAGFSIQDGNGISGGSVNLQITGLYNLTGNTGNPAPSIPYITEYNISNTGNSNRGWITQLNDIVIRSSDINTPKGVRVLAEFDVLDGGQY